MHLAQQQDSVPAAATPRPQPKIRMASEQHPSLGWTTPQREQMLWLCLQYVRASRLAGDYAEFGVWRGDTFATAYHLKEQLDQHSRSMETMRFHAFDSFEGFPELHGDDVFPQFQKGGRACRVEDFEALLVERAVPTRCRTTTKGWFVDTLAPGAIGDDLIADASLAMAYVDCDLYESTRDVLTFLQRKMMSGGVVIFDDWYCFAGHPLKGEQYACREFLSRYPEIELVPFLPVSWHGVSLIFHRMEPDERSRLRAMSREHAAMRSDVYAGG
jgi:O-methyltransferase